MNCLSYINPEGQLTVITASEDLVVAELLLVRVVEVVKHKSPPFDDDKS